MWARAGDRSAAEHLARAGGTSTGAARARLEASERLRRLPETTAALRRGELSQTQAETIADAAAVNPGSESVLLATARTRGLGELRERARRAKAAADPDPDATHRRLHAQRRLRRFTDGDGAWNVQARGTADAGAVFNASLDPIIDEMFRAAHRDGRHESRDAYAFDALLELARRARGERPSHAEPRRPTPETPGPVDPSPEHCEPAGDDGRVDRADTGRSEVQPPRPRSSTPNPTYLALLRVDVEALRRGKVEGDELCEIAGVGPVPARVARDLLGDAIAKLVITRGTEVANITHLGRGPTAAQRVALLWSTPACTNERCSNTLAIEHDHRTPWSKVHETATANLDRLCRPCHRRKTQHGWALVPGTGRRALVPPDDPRHPRHARDHPRGADRRPIADQALGAPQPTDDTAPSAEIGATTLAAGQSLFGDRFEPRTRERRARRSPVRAGLP